MANINNLEGSVGFDKKSTFVGEAVRIIIEDKTLWSLFGVKNGKISAESLANAGRNHFFEDYYFLLNELESSGGQILDRYFMDNSENGNHLVDLYKHYTGWMTGKEDPNYIQKINEVRLLEGLVPIKFSN
jgi:hypothetical protein